jgi:hypothetical protein
LVFGTDTAKVQVLPVLPEGERVTTIARGTANLPPYYAGLNGQDLRQDPSDQSTYSLLILQKKAESTEFLNVLLPFTGEKNPWKSESLDGSARRLSRGDEEVLLTGPGVHATLTTDGQCGVVSRQAGRDETYALIEGTGLSGAEQTLIASSLKTTVWAGRYDTRINALVSLKEKRASFELRPWPGDAGLLLNPPLAVRGQEPTAPLLISVSFHLDAKPARMVVLHSFAGEPKLDDPEFDKEAPWPRDYHSSVYKRQPLKFVYDEVSGMVTVLLEPGEHQVVWE